MVRARSSEMMLTSAPVSAPVSAHAKTVAATLCGSMVIGNTRRVFFIDRLRGSLVNDFKSDWGCASCRESAPRTRESNVDKRGVRGKVRGPNEGNGRYDRPYFSGGVDTEFKRS